MHPNINSNCHGNFDIFYISHNNDNGGNKSINLHFFSQQLQWIRPEELLVGKIIDNGILFLARIIVFLHQNKRSNGPILTLFESLVVVSLIAIALGMTERNHKEAIIECMLAHSLPADLSPCKFCNLVSF
jgi:hypothetical protein